MTLMLKNRRAGQEHREQSEDRTLDQLWRRVESLEQQNSKLNSTNANQNETIASLNATIAKLTAEYGKIQGQLIESTADRNNLHLEKDRLEKRVVELEETRRKLIAENAAQAKQMKDMQDHIDRLDPKIIS